MADVVQLKFRNKILRNLLGVTGFGIDRARNPGLYNFTVWGQKKQAGPFMRYLGSTVAGLSIGGAMGGNRIYRNMTDQIRSTNPQSTMMNRAAWGPGYPTWFKTRGMPPDHLGATGDLTLSLSKLKHQSII